MRQIYIASYPRSGNTFLRIILNYCFGLKSASVYENDFENDKVLEKHAGHLERKDGKISFENQNLHMMKTHELRTNSTSAIYIIRDARPVCLSLFNFYSKSSVPLDQIILGNHRFGKWCDHIESWTSLEKQNILLIKYEDLISDIDMCLKKLSIFLEMEVISRDFPNRNQLSDGRYVKKTTEWRNVMSSKDIDLCNYVNNDILKKYNYIS